VFRAFARTVDEGRDQFVVLDTAPTGHTILLPDAVRSLLPRLRDLRPDRHPGRGHPGS